MVSAGMATYILMDERDAIRAPARESGARVEASSKGEVRWCDSRVIQV